LIGCAALFPRNAVMPKLEIGRWTLEKERNKIAAAELVLCGDPQAIGVSRLQFPARPAFN
jgi:hypothetical protein